MTTPRDPWHGFDWKTAILIGERERACIAVPERRAHNLRLAEIEIEVQRQRRAEHGIVLRQYCVQARGLPQEFGDWEERTVDLRLDLLGEDGRIFWSEIGAGIAIALRKGGRWFAIKTSACPEGRLLEVLAIDEGQAARLLRLPDDWEGRAEARKEESP